MHALASVDEIARFLDELLDAPRYEAQEPDSNRLLYRAGDGVSKVAVAVNVSLATILGAAKAGCHLLVTHHPPWAEVDLHLRDEKLQALEAAQVSLYSAHSSLDCARQIGNGWTLARALGVDVEGTFMDYHGGHAGVYGRTAGTFADLIRRAQSELGVNVEAHEHAKTFGRIAIVPGGAGHTTEMKQALDIGADTYVTGEGGMFSRMFARETGMNLLFGTHYATEAPGIKALGQRISDEAQVPWEFIAESPDVF